MMRTVALAVGIGLVVEALLPGTWDKMSTASRGAMVIGVSLIAYGLLGWQ